MKQGLTLLSIVITSSQFGYLNSIGVRSLLTFLCTMVVSDFSVPNRIGKNLWLRYRNPFNSTHYKVIDKGHKGLGSPICQFL